MGERKRVIGGTAVLRERERANPGRMEHSELLYLMHELSRMISTGFDQVMIRHNLTHAQWWALMHIYKREGVTQTELATIMQMGRASAGTLLERLEAKGWIERRADATDSRLRRVYLSPPVVPVFSVMQDEGTALFCKLLKDVSPDAEQVMLTGMRQMRANAERMLRQQAQDEPDAS
ncbi:MarR family winged helix-turn-helix transcriptional regulator [Devosia limi]|uniref:DNA-binding transcriptional regulator, MarR family n=1 Tax=Devosia limi DSM 17137 TaxID=1121477 RepID=A0A1M4YTM9_9HYPH|nr:MarR family transcriptional regulator [Devosia limi]SHF09098.1 DNA-binding transcriptional regulator, MarR family [Devosia limi DSM 17137]